MDTTPQGSDIEARPLAPVYRELRGTLLASLVKLTGDAQAAEDLLHDVMVKVLTHQKAGRPAPENLGGWLHAVARNAAIDWHRARRPHDELPEELAAPTDDEGDEGLALAHCLRPMAERLPAHYRATLVAAEFEGQPLKRIAQEQGISLAAAKTRASRGRKLLQQELVECCRVVLSDAGQVVDYDTRAASHCAPRPDGCGTTPGRSCKT